MPKIDVKEMLIAELDELESGANDACSEVIQRVRSSIDLVGIEVAANRVQYLTNAIERGNDTDFEKVQSWIYDVILANVSDVLKEGEADHLVAYYLSRGDFERAHDLLMEMPLYTKADEQNREYVGLVKKYHEEFNAPAVLQLLGRDNMSEGMYQFGLELANKKEFMRRENFQFNQGGIPNSDVLSFFCTYFSNFNDVGIRSCLIEISENIPVEILEIISQHDFEFILLFIYLAEKRLPGNLISADYTKRLKGFLRVRQSFSKDFFKHISFEPKAYRGVNRKEYETFWEFDGAGVKSSDLSEVIESPMGKAVLKFSESDAGKREVFEGAECLKVLKNPQGWITINEPALAKDIYEKVLVKAGAKKDVILKLISKFLGRPVRALNEDDFKFYADEIIDGLNEFVRNSNLKDDADILESLEKCKFDFRYIKRNEDDLRMGSKTGDCTAPGSINFENSLSWQVNPAYQVIKLQKGGRFLGRVNVTLGAMNSAHCIFVDAVEFNPQAQETNAPYHEMAKTVFLQTIEHLLKMCATEERRLIMYKFSNSSDYKEFIEYMGLRLKKCGKEKRFSDAPEARLESKNTFTFLDAFADAKKVLADYGGDIKLWYQMMGASIEGAATLPQDKIAYRLEREIFNPGQIAQPDIAEAMRSRDFEKASALFIENYSRELWAILGVDEVPSSMVKRKLEQVYPLSKGITVHRVLLDSDQFFEVVGRRRMVTSI